MIELSLFIHWQRECSNCNELGRKCSQKASKVRQRINKLRKQGYGNKLRPYSDLHLPRGRRTVHDEMRYIADYTEPMIADDEMNDELIEIKTHSPQTVS